MIFIGIKCNYCGNVGIMQDRPVGRQPSLYDIVKILREALSKRRWRPVGDGVETIIREDVCPECIKKLTSDERKTLGRYTRGRLMSYVYITSEKAGHDGATADLFTIGFYAPTGEWMPESDYPNSELATERVHWLNGGPGTAFNKDVELFYERHAAE